jgi:hypothetical protein
VRAMARTGAKAERVLGLLLLALVLTMSLLLVQPAQARAEEPGISTTQTADPNPAIVGEPYTFIVSITNNSVPQRVGLKDFLPTAWNSFRPDRAKEPAVRDTTTTTLSNVLWAKSQAAARSRSR